MEREILYFTVLVYPLIDIGLIPSGGTVGKHTVFVFFWKELCQESQSGMGFISFCSARTRCLDFHSSCFRLRVS